MKLTRTKSTHAVDTTLAHPNFPCPAPPPAQLSPLPNSLPSASLVSQDTPATAQATTAVPTPAEELSRALSLLEGFLQAVSRTSTPRSNELSERLSILISFLRFVSPTEGALPS